MNKVKVVIDDKNIVFSKYNKKIASDNLNNTNIIDTQNLIFSEEYILTNLELVASFLNLVIVKNDVKCAIIKNIEIAESILELLNSLTKIEKVIFTENKDLNYTLASLLLKNKYLNKIECYSLPNIMFEQFPKNVVDTRCEILFFSEFMNYNNINTYSKIFNTDKIVIDIYLTRYDVDDIIFFFKNNKNLKEITIKGYNQHNFIAFLNLLKENNLSGINIILSEEESVTEELLNDVNLFEKLNKEYNVNIKIKYSKKYKEINKLKEININFIKTILLIIIFVSILFIILIRRKESNDISNIDVNIDVINENIEEIIVLDNVIEDIVEAEEEQTPAETNTYISPYYTNYDLIYNKLTDINSDTIGWIKINNTKVNYPVVQASDNDYYLNHSFDKNVNGAGWIFVDYRDNLDNLSKNIIMYGHNVKKNELMFGSLKYVLEDSWLNNPDNMEILFDIKGNTYKWQIFSIYTIDKTNDYLITDFSSNKSFKNYIDREISRSIKNFNVNVDDNDIILTLSTCYNDSNHRLVIHAKKI